MADQSITAYPLSWPVGWPRETYRRHANSKFKNNTFAKARDSLGAELERLGARSIVLSTNIELRLDGLPRGGCPDHIPDPGVAVYFTLKGKPMVMARDAWTAVSDNLRSLALAVTYLRGIHRHGGASMVERVFTGFAALPDPNRAKSWRDGLGIEPSAIVTADDIKARHRELSFKHHPDRGGSESMMTEINRARDEALKEIGAA